MVDGEDNYRFSFTSVTFVPPYGREAVSRGACTEVAGDETDFNTEERRQRWSTEKTTIDFRSTARGSCIGTDERRGVGAPARRWPETKRISTRRNEGNDGRRRRQL